MDDKDRVESANKALIIALLIFCTFIGSCTKKDAAMEERKVPQTWHQLVLDQAQEYRGQNVTFSLRFKVREVQGRKMLLGHVQIRNVSSADAFACISVGLFGGDFELLGADGINTLEPMAPGKGIAEALYFYMPAEERDRVEYFDVRYFESDGLI